MPAMVMPRVPSFMDTNIPRFLERFNLSYHREDTCIEYFIRNSHSRETLSQALILSYNSSLKGLHVSKFYPELFRQAEPKYLSAACFYMLIHHCAAMYVMNRNCNISLETTPEVYEAFYGRLKDFDFHIQRYGLGRVVELISDFIPHTMDISMIRPRLSSKSDILFLCE